MMVRRPVLNARAPVASLVTTVAGTANPTLNATSRFVNRWMTSSAAISPRFVRTATGSRGLFALVVLTGFVVSFL